MENATQALLIAGGILLALMTVLTLVYLGNNLAIIGQSEQEKIEQERLNNWNAEWEAYNKKLLYGADVLTVLNKAKQNDIDYDYSATYKVDIQIKGKDEYGNTITKDNIENYKVAIFTCTEILYSDETGRVNSMTFEFVSEGYKKGLI